MWRASMKAFPFVDEVCRRRRWPGPTNPDSGAAGAPEVYLASEKLNRNGTGVPLGNLDRHRISTDHAAR